MRRERVLEAAKNWIWYPENSRTLDHSDYFLLGLPSWVDRPTQVVRIASQRPADELVAEVNAELASWGREQAAWWVRDETEPVGLEAILARDGTLDETCAVLARDLAGGLPDLGPTDDVEVRPVLDVATNTDAHQVMGVVFGGEETPADVLSAEATEAARQHRDGTALTVVGYLAGRPVCAGGVTIADGVARLWGGATLREARGRGGYRAVLGARLRWATDHGADLALVKGRVQTSAPILARLGFASYGEERSYLMPTRG